MISQQGEEIALDLQQVQEQVDQFRIQVKKLSARLTNELSLMEHKLTQQFNVPNKQNIQKSIKTAIEKVHDVIAHSNNKLWTAFKKQEIKMQRVEADLRKLKHFELSARQNFGQEPLSRRSKSQRTART